MSDSGKSLGIATGMAAGVNAVLFLIIVWILAVDRGLHPQRDLARLFSPPATPEPEEILLVAVPEPMTPPEKAESQNEKYRNTPEGTQEQEPEKDTEFVSDKSTRAASSLGPRPDGKKGHITQEGADVASIDMRDATFRNENAATASQSAATPPDTASPNTATGQSGETPPPPVAFRDPEGGFPVPLRDSRDRPPPPAPREDKTPGSGPSGIKARLDGDVEVRGPDALDAKAGPVAAFLKTMKSLYEPKFEERRKSLGGILGRGLVEVEFDLDLTGKISNLRITNPGEANSVMQDSVLTIVLSTKLPPIPPEVAREWAAFMVDGKVKRTLSFLRH